MTQNAQDSFEFKLISDQQSEVWQPAAGSDVISDSVMALDLTPRFRRLNSQTCLRKNMQLSGVSGPFKATQLWQNIIEALQTQVEHRPRRHHLRIHHDCFTGSDAVDVVLSHLMQNIYFSSSEVSRLKAAKLCQALMESRVFEPVGMKLFRKEKEMTFEDSSCSLYRFLDSSDPYRKRYNQNQNPDQHNGKKTTSKFGEKQTISNPFVLGSSDRRVERLLKNINLHPSVPSDLNRAAFSNGFLSKKVVREVWKQQALLQLLQVVEIPMLDCILTSPAKPEPLRSSLRNHGDLVISNTCCGRSEDSLRASQLFLHLVEPTSRDELRRLLGFMAAATDSEAFRLHKQIENRVLVSRTFAKAVIQNKEMDRVQCEQLLLFFMDHYTQLFKTPSSLIKAVTDTLQSLQQGRDLDNVALFTFCRLVSLREYEDNRDKATLASLKQLMHHISQSDKPVCQTEETPGQAVSEASPGSLSRALFLFILESS
ncbi:DEP domain-containing protein 7 [Triplophysa tibetana]|uniref:DEP domain-containing protein 7 n=1 Tax=Triplophysa tibetana TaxID=1572043 RepID=A0A5A9PFH3_9TELE|nr:DEP domain-containing protein 7 [Triplophysa tibetana]